MEEIQEIQENEEIRDIHTVWSLLHPEDAER